MGSSDGSKGKPAYLYELDDAERPIPGTKKSAKQKPAVSHRRSDDKERRKSRSEPGQKAYEAMMAGAKSGDVAKEKDAKLERRKSSASSKSPRKEQTRPPSAHGNKGFHKINTALQTDHPSHFGISTSASRAPPLVSQPILIRPRAVTAQTYPARPLSYHAAYTGAGYGTGPPLSASAYYQPPLMPTPSYPPPSPLSSYVRNASTPEPSYFPPPLQIRPLSTRFDPIQRTSSAYGTRDPPIHHVIEDAYESGYNSASEGPRRRASIREPTRTPLRSKAEADYDAMPPPPTVRPGILRNRTTEYHSNTSVTDPPHRESRSTYRDEPPPRRQSRSTHRNSVSYDLPVEQVRVETGHTANTSHRRQSYYGQSASSGNSMTWEEQARNAQSYQEDVSGPTDLLTAEKLRHHTRHAGSSRSTKSSGSRDDSDNRRSATTRTTHTGSGPDDENVTIKVTGGQARVLVNGAQIDCAEGGEIEIKRQQKTIRNGSEPSISEYGGMTERRSSRADRPPGRSRRSSQSGYSYTRTSPQYGAPAGFF